MKRPGLLDLFSCAGGAHRGYAMAGFDVTGVDIAPQPNYPFEFIQADALEVLADTAFLQTFDLIHTSPPCQHDTGLKYRYKQNLHPDLIGPTQELLDKAGVPFVIENVEQARHKLRNPILLCGHMTEFPGLRVFRHRYFETSGFDLPQPTHVSHRGVLAHTLDKRKAHYGKTSEWANYVQVNGGGNSTKAAALDAMGVPHRTELTKQEINEAIPPAYTRYIAQHLAAALERRAAA